MSGKPGYPLPPGAATVSAEEVRGQLQRILTSSPFLNARRASQFLRFVVEGTLAGEDGFKEYLIGIEVFERPQDYDPKDDPVVRIEAGRLRKKLAEFYAGPGVNDPILIELPKGGYAPVFRERPAGVELEKVEVEPSTEPEAQPPTKTAAVAPNPKWWRVTALAAWQRPFSWPPGSIIVATESNPSQKRTRSSSGISRTRRATRCSTTR